MTTLHHLELAVIDMSERMRRELQFSSDARKQIRDSFIILRDALDATEKAVNSAFDERMMALSSAIGTGAPSPETVDHALDAPVTMPKAPRLSKNAEEQKPDASL